jgi:hypothetical protein
LLVFGTIFLAAYVLWRIIWFATYGGKIEILYSSCSGAAHRLEFRNLRVEKAETFLQDADLRHILQLFQEHHEEAGHAVLGDELWHGWLPLCLLLKAVLKASSILFSDLTLCFDTS